MVGLAGGRILSDPAEPYRLLAHCPAANTTTLRDMPELARTNNVAKVFVKDESARMGLGSFKALGAAYVIARFAMERAGGPEALARHSQRQTILSDMVFACASAGNHGLSVASGARIFGARAIVYIADSVPEPFAGRLRDLGAEVRRVGAFYEASMEAAKLDCERNGWTLLSDSSWPGYVELPMRVMEGYLVVGAEVADQIDAPPTHIFLQAGVGGFAAAMTAHFRMCWGEEPTIIVVEPDAAATLLESVRAGQPTDVPGPESIMGRLDCKSPSHLALAELARNADIFQTISDQQSLETVGDLGRLGIPTTPSGAAGFAGFTHLGADRDTFGLNDQSRVLIFVTEGPEG
ncbi:diaminopropionate ammonia-lyase [Devosia rhodophyticola]|uniref:Diaminopropionate ammonia-lyase n=1 Tax=Devosia rhodophyticola TaxID=3026423 RepID=A0ABY7Z1Q3_9HYPH|nr:diaminopropionate ammonia-lyase [Devosia rhodophyticola]WDR07514.1 diaminopropionate ammonia-lyase [Devosia rhodophyticola]